MAKTVGLSAPVWVRIEDVCYRKATLRQGGALGVLYGYFRYVSPHRLNAVLRNPVPLGIQHSQAHHGLDI